jgi:chromosome segregation ATPase
MSSSFRAGSLRDPTAALTRSGELHSSIFSQANYIGQFLRENAARHTSDPCFAMLQSFFEIFSDQLRMNADLRSRLIRRRYDPDRFESLKAEVASFLAEFSEATGSQVDDLDAAHRIFRRVLKHSAQCCEVADQLAHLDAKNSALEAKISAKREELESRMAAADARHSSLATELRDIESRNREMQHSLDTLTPEVLVMKERLQHATDARGSLFELVGQKKSEIESAKAQFARNQRRFMKLKASMATRIRDLRAIRRQLKTDEQPLLLALDEAEADLKAVEAMAAGELEQLAKERSSLEAAIQSLSSQLVEVGNTKCTLMSRLQELQDEATQEDVRADELSRLARLESANLDDLLAHESQLLSNAETADEQIRILVESVQDVEHTVSERREEIERLRKDNNRTRSLIRINQEKIESLTEENRKLECSLEVQVREKEQLQATCEQEQRTCALYQSTTAEFKKLRESLGLPAAATTDEVVSAAVDSYKARHRQPKQKRVRRTVSPARISSALDSLSTQITQLYSHEQVI